MSKEAWNTRAQAVETTLGSERQKVQATTSGEVDEGCYLVRDGKKFPVELNYGFLGIMPITITVGGFRYLVEVPDEG